MNLVDELFGQMQLEVATGERSFIVQLDVLVVRVRIFVFVAVFLVFGGVVFLFPIGVTIGRDCRLGKEIDLRRGDVTVAPPQASEYRSVEKPVGEGSPPAA